jgi:hypothetical protein
MNTLILTLLVAGPVNQLPPPPVPYTSPAFNYNYDRAYRHFLGSPSGLKTFSSLGQGYRIDTFTPFGHQGFYEEPGYEHQRIGPSGWKRYYRVPGYGGSYDTPFFGGGYGVPGYGVYSSTPPYYLHYPSLPPNGR